MVERGEGGVENKEDNAKGGSVIRGRSFKLRIMVNAVWTKNSPFFKIAPRVRWKRAMVSLSPAPLSLSPLSLSLYLSLSLSLSLFLSLSLSFFSLTLSLLLLLSRYFCAIMPAIEIENIYIVIVEVGVWFDILIISAACMLQIYFGFS